MVLIELMRWKDSEALFATYMKEDLKNNHCTKYKGWGYAAILNFSPIIFFLTVQGQITVSTANLFSKCRIVTQLLTSRFWIPVWEGKIFKFLVL